MAISKKNVISGAISLSLLMNTSGCSTIKEHATLISSCAWGTLIGTVGGAIAGKGDPTYMMIGAGVGLITGCGAGYYLENREKQLAKQAAEVGFQSNFERIEANDEHGVRFSSDANDDVIASQISISTERPMFASGKDRVTNRKDLAKLDQFLSGYIQTLDGTSKVFVVGHTDSSGSAKFNQQLSEKRALFIAKRMKNLGLDKNRIFLEGVGENQPIASNANEIGKAQNRRFEIIDVFSDSIASKAMSLKNVMMVSEVKKQRLSNVMTDEALDKMAIMKLTKQSAQKKEELKAHLLTSNLPEKSDKTTLPTNPILDRNPLQLSGKPFDQVVSSHLLSDKLGVYHDDSWSFISKAQASTFTTIESCATSEPKAKSNVYPLGDTTKLQSTSEYLPTLFGTKWYGSVEASGSLSKTMVILGPIFVDKDTYEADGSPELVIIPNWKKANKEGKSYRYDLDVETYRGNNTVLYRAYPKNKNALVDCADFIFSSKGSKHTELAEVIYTSRKTKFSSSLDIQTIL